MLDNQQASSKYCDILVNKRQEKQHDTLEEPRMAGFDEPLDKARQAISPCRWEAVT